MRDALAEQLANFRDIIDEYFTPFIDCVPGTQDRLNTLIGYMDALRLMDDGHELDVDAAHRIANRAMGVYVQQVHANYQRFSDGQKPCRKT